jgi:hypothetical protein
MVNVQDGYMSFVHSSALRKQQHGWAQTISQKNVI